MRMYEEVEVQFHAFLIVALDVGGMACFTLGARAILLTIRIHI
jgi:hypothetical protein